MPDQRPVFVQVAPYVHMINPRWIIRLFRLKHLTTKRKIKILFGGQTAVQIPDSDGGQFIYALIDPVTDRVFYVGRSNNPGRRYIEHFNGAQSEHTDKAKRIKQMINYLHWPYMIILEECDKANVNARERFWIDRLGGLRRLTNMKRG